MTADLHGAPVAKLLRQASASQPSGQMLAALVLASFPLRPALRSLPLPAKLAGGLFLFKTSVPAADKPFAGKLLAEAQQALRDDPRVTMELGAVSDRHSRTRASPLRRWLTPSSASCSALGPRGRRRLFERLELTRGRRRRA